MGDNASQLTQRHRAGPLAAVAAPAAVTAVRAVIGGSSHRRWLNRAAGSLAPLPALAAAAMVYVGVKDPSSWIGFEGGSR